MIPLHDNNPTHTKPFVTISLIVICILVYLWEISLPLREQARMIQGLGVTPALLLQEQTHATARNLVDPWLTIFTSMFLHGGWMHLLSNMLYLWIFGNNIEDAMGHGKFLLFYLLCGAAAVFANALPAPDSMLPMIGASGAISGVLGAYLLLYPHARVLIIVPLLFIMYSVWWPAWVVLIFWFILQIASSLVFADTQGGGIAWGAHIGGFIAGSALVVFFKHKNTRLFQG